MRNREMCRWRPVALLMPQVYQYILKNINQLKYKANTKVYEVYLSIKDIPYFAS